MWAVEDDTPDMPAVSDLIPFMVDGVGEVLMEVTNVTPDGEVSLRQATLPIR